MYRGRLYYESEGNYIDVHQFIIRDEQGAVWLTTTWGAQGKFSIDTQLRRIGDYYSTGKVRLKNPAGVVQTVETEIEFKVSHEPDDGVYIEGVWRESGIEYKFEGDLAK